MVKPVKHEVDITNTCHFCGKDYADADVEIFDGIGAVCLDCKKKRGMVKVKSKKVDWRKKYDRCHAEASRLSDEILIANWFLPEHIEEFLGRELTEDEYLKIIAYWHNEGGYDWVSSDIREWVNDNIGTILNDEGEE